MDTCMLCKSSQKDDIQYGEFLKNKHFGVHTYCLYLSSNLSQNGADDEGFLGFLEADIKKEVQRIALLKCHYCHKKYANIGCCDRRCRRTFHLICGLENKAENQFCRDYRSFCHSHGKAIKQRPSSKENCLICYDSLCGPQEKFNKVTMILTPCCRNGWFHKLCLQKFAKTAGYFFKCPLCNDSDVFREKLPARGIFIPNQDAAWELEPNAFAELLERPNECAAQECKNRKGRKASSDLNPFVMCSTCGSTAMHRQCLPNGGKRFHCADCTVALEEGDSGRESLNLPGNQDDEDELIDVCHVSDKEDLDIINRLIGASKPRLAASNRDSCTHHDQVVSRTSCESSEDGGEKIKPIATTFSRRLRSDSENSDLSVKGNRRSSMKSRTTSEDDKDSLSGSEEQIKPIAVASSCQRRLRSDSENSNQSQATKTCHSKRRHSRITSDTESSRGAYEPEEEVIKPTGKQSFRRLESDSESSDTVELDEMSSETCDKVKYKGASCRKRKSANIFSDSEDELGEELPIKQTRLEDKTAANGQDKSPSASEESDDDDDPLENFTKIVEKQKNISCIALRTRKSQNFKRHTDNTAPEKENEKNGVNTKGRSKEASNEAAKKSKFVKLKDEKCDKDSNLDISCIAKRTRRKSMDCRRNNKATTQHDSPENPLNASCIAIRTRRKTICAQTQYSQQSLYEMSQIYEKVHESEEEEHTNEEDTEDDDDESSTEQESVLNEVMTDTDLENFIVDDGYEEKDTKFEISCIANRTRKRKSLRFGDSVKRLPHIDEEEDAYSSTTSNCSSNSRVSAGLLHVNLRKRCQQRVNSSSSEDFEPISQQSLGCKTKTISPSLLLDKLPQHNYAAYLKPKYSAKSSSSTATHNYHPPNNYHPHSNNRKRF